MDITKLSQEVHRNAVDKGFWSNSNSIETFMMLVLTEVAEAVNADRENKTFKAQWKTSKILKNAATGRIITCKEDITSLPATEFKNTFELMVKDTVEDELADTFIRLADLAGVFFLEFSKLNRINYTRTYSRFSFAENAFALCKAICRSNVPTEKRIQFGMQYITDWCEEFKVDLEWHVKAKMKYNSLRPQLHGKKY